MDTPLLRDVSRQESFRCFRRTMADSQIESRSVSSTRYSLRVRLSPVEQPAHKAPAAGRPLCRSGDERGDLAIGSSELRRFGLAECDARFRGATGSNPVAGQRVAGCDDVDAGGLGDIRRRDHS